MFENRWSHINPLGMKARSAPNIINKLKQLVHIIGGLDHAPSVSTKSTKSTRRSRKRPSRARRGKSRKLTEGCNLDAAEVARRMVIIEANRHRMFQDKWRQEQQDKMVLSKNPPLQDSNGCQSQKVLTKKRPLQDDVQISAEVIKKVEEP